MATATGVGKVVVYKKETTFGEIPTATGGKVLRRVTANFNLTKETYESTEIRKDYQTADFRHGVRAVEGSLSGELSSGAYADFLASAVARDWTAITATTMGSATIAVSGAGFSITRTTGSFLTDGVRVGCTIRLTGFATANNDTNLLIVALTGTVATVIPLTGIALTPETVASGGAYTVVGKTTYAPLAGHTDDSYTVEEFYSDVSRSSVTTGNKVNTIAVKLPATGLTTVDFGFMGQDLKQRGTSQYFTSPTAQGSNGIFAAVNGALIVNGVPVTRITAVNLNINRNMAADAVVGSNIKPEIYKGRIGVDGDFSTLYQDDTFANIFDNETEISMVVALTESNLPTANFMTFTVPRIKLSTDTRDDGEKGIVSQNSFKALLGNGANGFEATTLMIQDSSLV